MLVIRRKAWESKLNSDVCKSIRKLAFCRISQRLPRNAPKAFAIVESCQSQFVSDPVGNLEERFFLQQCLKSTRIYVTTHLNFAGLHSG